MSLAGPHCKACLGGHCLHMLDVLELVSGPARCPLSDLLGGELRLGVTLAALPLEDDSDDCEFEYDCDFSDDEEECQGADGPVAPREQLQRKCTHSQAVQGTPGTSATPGFEPAVGIRTTAAAAVGSGSGGCIA